MSKLSLTQRLDSLPLSGWHWTLMIICSLSIFFDAFDSTVISVVMPQLIDQWGLTKIETGFLSSAGFIGMLIGAILFGMLADAIGRKKVFMITLLIYSLCTGLCALSNSFQMLFIFRVFVGFGLGGLVPVVSTYLTEYIPSKNRGKFLSWFNGFFQLGNAFAYAVGLLIVIPYGWFWAFIIGALPALIVIFVQRHLPESIRFLLQKNLFETAINIVENIENKILKKVTLNYDEAFMLEQEQAAKRTSKRSLKEIFTGQVLKSTIMISILWFCLNFCTYAVVMWLPVLLVNELGYNLSSGFSFLIIAAIVGCIGQLTAGVTADKFGRRITISASLILFGVCAYLLFWAGGSGLGNFFLIMMWVFLGSSWGSIYAYTPENFPTAIRGTGVGFAGSCGRLGGIFGPSLVGLIYAMTGATTILHMNFALLFIAAAIVLILGYETKNQTLEQIERAKL
jgi:putative MFS transporter